MSQQEDEISVKVSADSADLKQGMDQSAEATAQAMAKMGDTLKEIAALTQKQTEIIEASFKGVQEQAKHVETETKNALEKVVGTLNGFAKQAQAQLGKVAETFELVKSGLVAFAGVAAGGAALKKIIGDTNDWNLEAGKLAKQLGITTEAASVYMVATHKLGIEADALGNAAMRVSMQIMKGGQGFEEMGVKVRNAGDTGFRPTMEIIEETIEKIKAIHDPILQNEAGLSAFGRAWGDIKPLMKLTADGMEEAKEKAEQLGLIVGTDGVAASKAYKENMREVSLALESLEINMGNALLPAFTAMTESMATVAGIVSSVLRPAFTVFGAVISDVVDVFVELVSGIKDVVITTLQILGDLVSEIFGSDIPKDLDIVGNSVKVIEIGFVMFAESVKASIEGIAAVIEGFERGVVMLAKMINSALKGDFADAKAAWDQGLSQIDDIAQKHANKIIQIQEDAKKKIDEIVFGKPAKTGKAEQPEADPNYDFSKGQKDKKDPGRTAQWEADLAARKDVLERQAAIEGNFREMSKQEEADYWEAILQRTDLTTNEKIAAQRKYYALEAQVRKDAFQADLDGMNATKEALGKNYEARIDISQQAYNKVVAAYGAESKEAAKAYAEILKERKSLADQIAKIDADHAATVAKIHQIEIDAQQKAAMAELDLIGAADGQKIALERKFLDEAHDLEVQDLQRRMLDTSLDAEAYAKLQDQKLEADAKYQAQKAALDSKAMAAASQPFDHVMQGAEQSFATALNGMMQHTQSFGQAMQSVWKGISASITQELANIAAAKLKSLAEDAIYGKTVVAQQAYQAAAKAYQSMVGIPIAGPFIAPIAAAGAFVAVEAFGAQIPSAANGFDIPSGVNPLTQLHEKEMVLPAEHADTIRNLGGQSGGEVHLHVHAVDSDSVERLFKNNGDALVKVLRQQHRKGALSEFRS